MINQKGFGPIILILVVLAMVSLIGGAYYLGFIKNNRSEQKQPSSNNRNISQKPQDISLQTTDLNLKDKILYATEQITMTKTGSKTTTTIYASDLNGKSVEVSRNIVPGQFSPNKNKLLYQKEDDNSVVYIKDLSTNTEIPYHLPAENIFRASFNWNPNSKEVVFILVTTPAPLKKEGGATILSGMSSVNKLGILNIESGNIQMIDTLNTPLANNVQFANLGESLAFLGSSKQVLYLYDISQCAPGPCYKQEMFTFNWITNSINKFIFPIDKGLIGGINSSSGEILVGDQGFPFVMTKEAGKLQLYNPNDNSLKTLVDDPGFSFMFQNANFLNDSTVLYSKTKLDDTAKLDKYNPSPLWYVLDLNTNNTRQLSYTGYDLRPLNESLGLIETSSFENYELSLYNFNDGHKIPIYSSKEDPFSIISLPME